MFYRICVDVFFFVGVVCIICVDILFEFFLFFVIFWYSVGSNGIGIKGFLGCCVGVLMESLGYIVELFGVCVGDGWEGVLWGGDGDVVVLVEFDVVFVVEGVVGGCVGVVRDCDVEGYGVGENYGVEGEGMRVDGSEEDGGDVWVDKGIVGGEWVGGWICGGGENVVVGLDYCKEFIVVVEFEVGDVGRWVVVNDKFVENFELFVFVYFIVDVIGVLNSVSEVYV